MDETKSAQQSPAKGEFLQFRDEDASFVADYDVLDSADTTDEEADLAAGLLGEGNDGSGQVSGDDFPRRDTPVMAIRSTIDSSDTQGISAAQCNSTLTVQWIYTQQKRADGSGGGQVVAGWDLQTNKKV